MPLMKQPERLQKPIVEYYQQSTIDYLKQLILESNSQQENTIHGGKRRTTNSRLPLTTSTIVPLITFDMPQYSPPKQNARQW